MFVLFLTARLTISDSSNGFGSYKGRMSATHRGRAPTDMLFPEARALNMLVQNTERSNHPNSTSLLDMRNLVLIEAPNQTQHLVVCSNGNPMEGDPIRNSYHVCHSMTCNFGWLTSHSYNNLLKIGYLMCACSKVYHYDAPMVKRSTFHWRPSGLIGDNPSWAIQPSLILTPWDFVVE